MYEPTPRYFLNMNYAFNEYVYHYFWPFSIEFYTNLYRAMLGRFVQRTLLWAKDALNGNGRYCNLAKHGLKPKPKRIDDRFTFAFMAVI